MEPQRMNDQGAPSKSPPTHELVYRRLRGMILFGDLAPGQPVTIQGLVSELGTGITPIREAIRRLTAEGALEFKGNRRISVPTLTLSQLDELSFARLTIEPQLAIIAASRMDANDIRRLESIDQNLNIAIENGDVPAYLEHNYHFHTGLYAHSDAQILLSIAGALWLRVGPSLRVVCGRYGTTNLPDKHEEALQALCAGDANAVGQAIHEDIKQGHTQIRSSLNGA